jgi:hypothetical protein
VRIAGFSTLCNASSQAQIVKDPVKANFRSSQPSLIIEAKVAVGSPLEALKASG